MIKIDSKRRKGHINKELHSQFIEFLGSCIYDGIWVGEDSAIPNYEGMRKDVVDALKELAPPVIRWPGGCYADTYHWKNGIGPREDRPITYNENFGTYEPDYNQFGTHEFMKLCEMVGAKPWLNINMMTASTEEMREWMEYCNRKQETTLSIKRKENGADQPFDVELWGIGNEVWAGGGTMTAESYAAEYRKYATAFPSFASVNNDESEQIAMKRIASGPDGNKPKERVQWTKDFFRELGKYRRPEIDGYDLHFYNWNLRNLELKEWEFSEEEWDAVISGCMELETVIQEQAELIKEGIEALPEEEGYFKREKPNCDLIVGEWGNWHGAAFINRPALFQQCTMRDAITTALTLDIFHRNCNDVKMACVAQTVNVLNSLILTEGETCIKTPNYDVFQMYKVHRDAEALDVVSQEENVHVFASVKENQINVNLVNTSMTEDTEVRLSFADLSEYVSGQVLESADPHAFNTKENPDMIRVREVEKPQKENGEFLIHMKAASVQVLCFEKYEEKK